MHTYCDPGHKHTFVLLWLAHHCCLFAQALVDRCLTTLQPFEVTTGFFSLNGTPCLIYRSPFRHSSVRHHPLEFGPSYALHAIAGRYKHVLARDGTDMLLVLVVHAGCLANVVCAACWQLTWRHALMGMQGCMDACRQWMIALVSSTAAYMLEVYCDFPHQTSAAALSVV
jgi:hypothetical protein